MYVLGWLLTALIRVILVVIALSLGVIYVFLWIVYIWVIAAPRSAGRQARSFWLRGTAKVAKCPRLATALAVLAVWLGIATSTHWYFSGFKDRKFYGEIVQLCFSSWPNHRPESHTWPFAVGVSTRLTLVLGSFGGLIGLFWSMIAMRKKLMRYDVLAKLHDLLLRANFLTEVRGLAENGQISKDKVHILVETLNKAISQADLELMEEMRQLFGDDVADAHLEEEAKKLLQNLQLKA